MIRRPPRSTQSRSSAASDVYKRQLLHNFRCERGNLEIALVTQLPADRPKNTRPSWVAIVVNKNGSVLVETYQTTAGPTNFSLRPHDNTLDDRALDDCCVWSRLLHSNHALVANMPHLVLVVCEDRDDSDFFRARVVGNDHMTVGSKHSAPPRQSFPPWLRPQQASSAWSWKSDG